MLQIATYWLPFQPLKPSTIYWWQSSSSSIIHWFTSSQYKHSFFNSSPSRLFSKSQRYSPLWGITPWSRPRSFWNRHEVRKFRLNFYRNHRNRSSVYNSYRKQTSTAYVKNVLLTGPSSKINLVHAHTEVCKLKVLIIWPHMPSSSVCRLFASLSSLVYCQVSRVAKSTTCLHIPKRLSIAHCLASSLPMVTFTLFYSHHS
jgi:hypothetical protein